MAISQTQIVDILYKKLSGVSKTDTSTAKSPANEANASPQLSPGTTIWQQDYLIPSVTTLPTSNSSVVTVYRDSLSSTVQSTALSESVANETWTTNLTNWIPPQFGAGYQVKLYAGPSGSATPQNFINLPVGGSGNNDSWYFDYAAGIVNFADTNVPTAVTGNVVYVVGARYVGVQGITTFANLQIANITISGNTITGNANGISINSNITTGNLIINGLYNPNGSLFSNYGNTQVAAYLPIYGGNLSAGNIFISGNTITNNANGITISSNVTAGNLLITGLYNTNGTLFSNYGNTQVAAYLTVYTGNITAANINSSNIYVDNITPNINSSTVFASNTAIGLPTGTSGNRPTASAGYIRYNTDYNNIEYYDGNEWVPINNAVADQIINPDGVNASFTLNQSAISSSVLVSINGVVQQPEVSYTVSGTTITFTQVPGVNDYIDIRYLATLITSPGAYYGNSQVQAYFTANIQPTLYSNANVASYLIANPQQGLYSNANVATYFTANIQPTLYSNANVLAFTAGNLTTLSNAITANINNPIITNSGPTVGTVLAIVDSFYSNVYRSARYTISSTNPYDSQMSEVMLVQNNNIAIINNFGILNTGANTVSYYANINGNTVNLLANSTTNSNQLRIQKTYFVI